MPSLEPWRFELFGTLIVSKENRSVSRFRTRKTASLAAWLALNGGKERAREHLVEQFWPEASPEQGRNSLSNALSDVRRILEPPGVERGAVLVATRDTVALRPDAFSSDVAEFRTALSRAEQAARDEERMALLARGLALYRGPLLATVDDDVVVWERERLAALFSTAGRSLVELHRRRHDTSTALGVALGLVSVEPLREELHRDILQLYLASGRRREALQHYRELERSLAAAVSASPEPETTRLVSTLDTPDRPADLAAAAPRSSADVATPASVFTLVAVAPDGGPPAGRLPIEVLRSHLDGCGGADLGRFEDRFAGAFRSVSRALSFVSRAREAPGGALLRVALHMSELSLRREPDVVRVLGQLDGLLRLTQAGSTTSSEAAANILVDCRWDGAAVTLHERPSPSPEGSTPRVFEVRTLAAGTGPAPASAAPLRLTRLVGRERELEEISDALHAPGAVLVTVTGLPGCGKTRLALAALARERERFDGHVFVTLDGVARAETLGPLLLEGVGATGASVADVVETVARRVGAGRWLFVLDGFEHLVGEAAGLVRALLDRCPELRCLVTSVRRLGVGGERELRLEPLAAPPAETSGPSALAVFEAVRFFVQCAREVQPDFEVTVSNAAAIGSLCRRLDGLPLALELAGHWAQVLAPRQMLDRLENPSSLLVSRLRDVAPRHRSLRAALEATVELLAPEVRRFLGLLSVFHGTFPLEGAERVGDVPLALDFVAELRDHSLVVTESDGTRTRFRLLQSVRDFAATLLAPHELEEARGRHFAFWLEAAEAAEAVAAGAGASGEGLARELLRGYADVQAAMSWAFERGTPRERLRLGAALGELWARCGQLSEGRRFLERIREAPGEPPGLRAKVHHDLASLARLQGDFLEARRNCDTALALRREAGDLPGLARTLNLVGVLARSAGDLETARRSYEEALALARPTRMLEPTMRALGNLGIVSMLQGDLAAARAALEEALGLTRQAAKPSLVAGVLANLGIVGVEEGDLEAARACFDESLSVARAGHDPVRTALALRCLGDLELVRGSALAAEHLRAALGLSRELGQRPCVAECLQGLARVAHMAGDDDEARSLLRESLELLVEETETVTTATGLTTLAELWLAKGDPTTATRLLAGAATAFRSAAPGGYRADRARHAALCVAAEGGIGTPAYAGIWSESSRVPLASLCAWALRETGLGSPSRGARREVG